MFLIIVIQKQIKQNLKGLKQMKYKYLPKQTKQKIVTHIKGFINAEGGLFGLDHWTIPDTGYTRTFSYLEQVLRYLPNIDSDKQLKEVCGLTNEDLNDFELVHDLLEEYQKDVIEEFNSPKYKEQLKREHEEKICDAVNLLLSYGWEVKEPKDIKIEQVKPIEEVKLSGPAKNLFDSLNELANETKINSPAADGHK